MDPNPTIDKLPWFGGLKQDPSLSAQVQSAFILVHFQFVDGSHDFSVILESS